MRLKYILFFLLLFIATQLHSQTLTTKGKEFYLTYLYNSRYAADTAKIFLLVTAPKNTTGTISNPGTGFSIPFSITAGNVTQIELPKYQAMNFLDGVVQNTGVIVNAADTITAFALNTQPASSDAANLIQKDALGSHYLVACYYGLNETFFTPGYMTAFAVMATEDNTSVSITPSAKTYSGSPAGVPFTILLNRGQVYYVNSFENLAGSWVSVNDDCKKIAVFSGAEVNYVPAHMPDRGSGDHMYEQLFPVSAFGKQFITTKLKGRNVYIARVYAAYDNTTVIVEGVVAKVINAGQFYELESLNQAKYITTSNPCEVMMFGASTEYDVTLGPKNDGDPTMITIPPLEQKLTESIFLSPEEGRLKTHKVNIVCKTVNVYSTVFDGINVGDSFSVVPGNPVYSYAAMEIKAGQHSIQNPKGFIAYAYGFGDHQGYGYCTGSAVRKIDAYFTCNGFSSIDNPTVDICTGPAVFDIVTSKINAAYTWDFGDGRPAVTTDGTVLQQIHNYPSPGDYIVKLKTTSSIGNACELATTDSTQLTLHVVTSLTPAVTLIKSPQGPVCTGTPVSFIATAFNTGPAPVYLWKLNGATVGTNSPTYTDSIFNNNDVISCIVTSSLVCASGATDTANVTIQINSSAVLSVSISTDSTNVCGSSPITIKAIIPVGIPSLVYQWKVNRVNMGTNSASFTYTPNNGDSITCELTASGTCYNAQIATSNVVVMSVQPAVNSPSVSISADQTIICAGSSVSFTAVPVNGGTAPTYQWKLNGANAGTNSAIFTSGSLKNNDTVRCILTSNQGCLITPTALSNNIIMQVNPVITPSVSIASTAAAVCQGKYLTITATPVNGGAAPVYQWKINGSDVINSGPVFTSSNFNNNDIVSCIMTGNATCTINPALSNNITVTVNPTINTSVTIQASDNRICKGEAVTFTATAVNGGTAPVYKWYLNGTTINNSANTYSTASLNNTDKISCAMVSSLGCTDTATSTAVIMQVDPLPTVLFNPAALQILYGSSVQLAPTITGDIANYLWTPSDNLSSVSSATTIANPLENKQYKLAVTTAEGCKADADVTVKVFRNLLMPNAFTPDGNNVNDLFRIPPGISLSISYFIVYNRFGEKVFETTDATKGWDGTFKGSELPSGAFTWAIQYKNPFNNEIVLKKGTVLLLR